MGCFGLAQKMKIVPFVCQVGCSKIIRIQAVIYVNIAIVQSGVFPGYEYIVFIKLLPFFGNGMSGKQIGLFVMRCSVGKLM